MAADLLVKTNLQGLCTLSDGTGTPVTLDLIFDRGDFAVGPIKKVLQATTKIERRGHLVTVTPGARIYPTGSFSCWVPQLTDATAGVVTDFILFQNKYSANITTLATDHPVNCLDIIYTLEGAAYGGADETITLADCDITIDTIQESIDGTFVSFSFEVLGAITGSLAAAELA